MRMPVVDVVIRGSSFGGSFKLFWPLDRVLYAYAAIELIVNQAR